MNRVTSLRRLAHAASIGIGLVCLLHVWLSFIYRPVDSYYLPNIDDPNFDGPMESDAAVNASLFRNLVLLVAGVLFLAWLGRARRNLQEFKGEERAFGPGWTVGAWLIPIANIIMPALVTADVARGSTTDQGTRRRLVALVWMWWICYLGNAVTVFGLYNAELFNPVRLLGTASYIAAGVLVITLMYKIVEAQRARFCAVTEPDPADFPTFTVGDLKPAEAD